MLTEKQRQRFDSEGFVLIPQVVDPDRVKELRAAHEALLDGWIAECESNRDEYERVVNQWTNLHEQHPAFRRQIHHTHVLAIARELLGVSHLQLFHDHFISKPPAVSSEIPWHQDYPLWPLDRPKAISCWLALDDADTESGAMFFMPGAHLDGEKPPVDFLHAPKQWGPRAKEAVPTTLRAGDCIFHSCLSWHMSPPNRSDHPRRAFIAIMMSADCCWDPSHSSWHPLNECVTAAPGEHFNADRFPLLGNEPQATGQEDDISPC